MRLRFNSALCTHCFVHVHAVLTNAVRNQQSESAVRKLQYGACADTLGHIPPRQRPILTQFQSAQKV